MSKEDFIQCPLDCGARIKSLYKHLTKCQNKKLLGIKYKTCIYNTSHIIKNEFYELHLLSCESKKVDEDDDEEDSFDDNFKKRFNDNININNINNGIENKDNNNKDEENEKKLNVINNRKKKRYRHENALFKNENEITQECLDFFNKVYI